MESIAVKVVPDSPAVFAGVRWPGEDLVAGLEMVKLLFSQTWAEEIVRVDVSNYAGRVDLRDRYPQHGRPRPLPQQLHRAHRSHVGADPLLGSGAVHGAHYAGCPGPVIAPALHSWPVPSCRPA